MRVLILEDEEEILEALAELVVEVGGEAFQAKSRDGALELLETENLDLIICDLNVPTEEGALDGDIQHGRRVQLQARELQPGTPVIAFSARGNPTIMKEMIREASADDIFGDGSPVPMLDFFEKSDLDDLRNHVHDLAGRLASLGKIEIATEGVPLDLSTREARVIQIYANHCDGAVARVAELGGGLSSARSLRVHIRKSGGAHAGHVVAKIGLLSSILDEEDRYLRNVAGVLPHGAYADLAFVVRAGSGPLGGVFYALLDGYEISLFELAEGEPTEGAAVVERLAHNLGPWSDGASTVRRTIREVRQELTRDDELGESLGRVPDDLRTRLEAFEASEFEGRMCVRHGDFHGANILVRADMTPVIIDYGRVSVGAACLDPVLLELSVLLHPNGTVVGSGWPNKEQAEQWINLEAYLVGSPVPEFVMACRTWANSLSGGDRDLVASAYAYVIRQLRYDHTDRDRANDFLRGFVAKVMG